MAEQRIAFGTFGGVDRWLVWDAAVLRIEDGEGGMVRLPLADVGVLVLALESVRRAPGQTPTLPLEGTA